MTLSKPGHNRFRGNSASASIHEGTPEIQDGPEGYSEDAPSWESDDDQKKTSQYGYTTGTSGAGRGTTPESYRVEMRRMDLAPARFGSPFTYKSYRNKEDFFIGLLDKGTRVLFDQVVAEASTLREHLSTGLSLTDNRDNPHLCYLKRRESSSKDTDNNEESDTNESKLGIRTLDTDSNVWLLDADMGIEVHCDRESKPGEISYFIINNGRNTFHVNDWSVEPVVKAGPLPDFAVIQTGQYSYFWWRTAAALDYKPKFKRKRRSEDDDGESPSKALKSSTDGSYCTSAGYPSPYEPEPPPDPQVFPDSKNWLDEYRRRLAICEKRPMKCTTQITAVHPPHQYPSGDMQSIDIILAIGAVWLGLMEAKVDYAYADSDLFSLARSTRMVGMHAVKGTNHFLMPLLFNEESPALSPEPEEDTAEPLEPVFSAFQRGEQQRHQKNLKKAEKVRKQIPGRRTRSAALLEGQKVQNQGHKGGIGHFMLAIAEKVCTDPVSTVQGAQAKEDRVRLRFMDSADGVVEKGLIRRVARNTVRHAGWLGDIWPRFDASEECWADVLKHSGNKSGEHTVLNAWAYMLGIPLATTREKGLGHSTYKDIRGMISLALRGQLDSLTIRAWMQHSKYAVEEPLSQLQQIQVQQPDLPNNLRNMQTVALNQDAFNQIVKDIYTQEQAGKQTHAMKSGDVTVKSQGQRMNLNVLPSVTLPASRQDAAFMQRPISRYDPAFSQHPAFRNHLESSQDPAFMQDPASAFSQDSNPSSPSVYHSVNPPNTADASPKTWQHSLDQRLAFNITESVNTRRNTNDALKNASIIRGCSDLADYEVVLGIAPIWEGIKRLGRPDFDFAYAEMDIFAPGGPQEKIGAVGGWSRFIMPLYFSEVDPKELENQGKGKAKNHPVGHLLLCVAELVDVTEACERPTMTVQLEILDSRPGTVHEDDILREAKSKIRVSRWLGRRGRRARVKYKLIVRNVPHQVGNNACGLFTILNAWAYMLGIPIHPGRFRRGRDETTLDDETDSIFLSLGLEMVNLALKGFMDSATIQAFFQVYGYSVEQRFGDPTRAAVEVHAIGMNMDKLRRTMRRRKVVEKTTSARAENRRFADGDMRSLMNLPLTEEEAWTALVMGKGNVDSATAWYYSSLEDWGQLLPLPPPEEALSPQTPAWRRLVGQRPPPGNGLPSQVPDARDGS